MIADPASCVVPAMAERYQNKGADFMKIIGVFSVGHGVQQ